MNDDLDLSIDGLDHIDTVTFLQSIGEHLNLNDLQIDHDDIVVVSLHENGSLIEFLNTLVKEADEESLIVSILSVELSKPIIYFRLEE